MMHLALALLIVQHDEKDFEKIFNEFDLTGWSFVTEDPKADPAKTYSIVDGALVCSGAPSGYLKTDKSYSNFTLRFDWRYKRPDGLAQDADFGGNSGYLLFITEPKALGIWPKSIEVQGMNRDAGNILPIPRGVACKFSNDAEARAKVLKPVGEWNSMEIHAHGGFVIVNLNGVKVAEVTECELKEGPIGFQSEGAEIHWRNIRILEEK